MAQLLNQSAWHYPYDKYSMVYLEHRQDGHHKFYEMTNTGGGSWSARWGKIGTTGQTMTYPKTEWFNKLSEKIQKGYSVEGSGTSLSASALPAKGTPPPVIKPRKPDPDILIDTEVMAKLDRVELFLDEKGKINESSLVSAIKEEYVRTGILTKSDMKKLNDFWIKNGGGKW